MDDAHGSGLMSRRRLLGAGLVGAGSVALAGCISDPDPTDAIAVGEIRAERVPRVPVDSPTSSTWARTRPTVVAMGPQNIALPQRAAPAVPQIVVRAVHDGAMVAFRLDWADPDVDDLTVRVDEFRDACAVLLTAGQGDQTLRTMGSATQPATLIQWKADWERDENQGRQGRAAVYPNATVDVYPPIYTKASGEVTPADYVAAGATAWLPGLRAGNPLSQVERKTCVEKGVARGFGTFTTCATQDAVGGGQRTDRGWRVVLAKPLGASDTDEMALAPGAAYTCAFAVWSGSTKDAGSRKSPSALAYQLTLAP